MSDDNMDDIQDLASAYVLGTLSSARRTQVEQRMQHDAALRRAVDEWEARLFPLNSLADPIEPSAQLWPRIQRTLGLERKQSSARSPMFGWWDSLAFWRSVTAGAFALTLVLAFALFTQAPPQPTYMVVLVAPQDKAPGWVIQASDDQRIKLIPLGKLEVPSDKSLQFWTKGEGWAGPVSLGLVKPGESLEVFLKDLPPLAPNQLFEITLEPYAGSPLNRPTGPVLHIGRAVQVM